MGYIGAIIGKTVVLGTSAAAGFVCGGPAGAVIAMTNAYPTSAVALTIGFWFTDV